LLGLVVRVGLVFAVTFAIVYAIVRARRASAHSAAAAQIQEELRLLRVGLEAGLYDDDDYRRIARRLRAACDEQGIQVPTLPEYIRPRNAGDEED
jgi:uncharacterized membrane protein